MDGISIVGSAAKHGIFNALEGGGDDARGVAQKSGISERGSQALLDGLTGLGLLNLVNGRYRNGPEAETFLVKGKPAYFGGMAEVMAHSMTDWTMLPDAVKTGPAAAFHTDGRQRVLACLSPRSALIPGGTDDRRSVWHRERRTDSLAGRGGGSGLVGGMANQRSEGVQLIG